MVKCRLGDPMLDQLVIEPMNKDLLLWRCLHNGPISSGNIESPASNPAVDWSRIRRRNLPLLTKLTDTYGACAIVARDGDQVIATLRFYPKALCRVSDEGGVGFCLQQYPPAGPTDDRAADDFPPPDSIEDKTLFVHCLFVAAPPDEPERYRRKGLMSEMVLELIHWAVAHQWDAIEAIAYEDLPCLYAISGVAGRRFWEKLGFRVVAQDVEPYLTGEYLELSRKDAIAVGIPVECAANRYHMRREIGRITHQ
jgi:hypothetical protein